MSRPRPCVAATHPTAPTGFGEAEGARRRVVCPDGIVAGMAATNEVLTSDPPLKSQS